jgi:hypothetical protein
MKRTASFARWIDDLVFYDEPQLVLMKTNRDHYMMAVAVNSEKLLYSNDMIEPFFCCEIRDKTYDRYFEQKADLHFTFTQAIGDLYYLFDSQSIDNGVVRLRQASGDEAHNASLWPETGFFAASHTSLYNISSFVGSMREFKIDGKWGAEDFSHFHGKMSDLYALFGAIRRFVSGNEGAEVASVKRLIQERFWRGGGSYVGFYDSLLDRNKLANVLPLEVAKIQYASPGRLTFKGDSRALSDISDMITTFEEKEKQLKRMYIDIYSILKRQRLLAAPPSRQFENKIWSDIVMSKSDELADGMRIDQKSSIYLACDSNVLVYAKVILSIYRRAKELHTFHAEGRVQPL